MLFARLLPSATQTKAAMKHTARNCTRHVMLGRTLGRHQGRRHQPHHLPVLLLMASPFPRRASVMNISAHFHPILPLTWAGFHQNQISTTYPLLPDSGRSDSELKFGPCTTELLLTYPLLWKTAQGSPQGQGPTLGLRPCQVNNAWQHSVRQACPRSDSSL